MQSVHGMEISYCCRIGMMSCISAGIDVFQERHRDDEMHRPPCRSILISQGIFDMGF